MCAFCLRVYFCAFVCVLVYVHVFVVLLRSTIHDVTGLSQQVCV